MRFGPLIVLALAVVAGCRSGGGPAPAEGGTGEGRAPGWNEEEDGDRDPLREMGVEPVDGPLEVRHPDGGLRAQGTVVQGVLHGEFRRWYPGGQLQERGTFEQGHEVGTWTLWHPNGQPYETVHWRAGEEHGVWTMFHDNGQVAEEMTWADGRQVGLQIDRDRQGQEVGRGEFTDHRPSGSWSCLDADGARRKVEPPRERLTPTQVCRPGQAEK
jgi:hypothetical protein